MSKLDDFESVFRSAIKEAFRFAPPKLGSVLLLMDDDSTLGKEALAGVEKLLAAGHGGELAVEMATFDRSAQIADLVDRVRGTPHDVVACFRHLLGRGKGLEYSLGSAVDTLTQELDIPVLLLPDADVATLGGRLQGTSRVLVITDHLTGDDTLVNWGALLCCEGGTLHLAHVEDDATFHRYADALSKLPGVDTETTTTRLRDKLLQMPRDYVSTVGDVLRSHGFNEHIEGIVTMGHAVADYRRLIDEHDIQIVVMNTKDRGQLAMHGMSYALAIEVHDRPLMLL